MQANDRVIVIKGGCGDNPCPAIGSHGYIGSIEKVGSIEKDAIRVMFDAKHSCGGSWCWFTPESVKKEPDSIL